MRIYAITVIGVSIALAGCSGEAEKTEKASFRKESRAKEIAMAMERGPLERTWKTSDGVITELLIPIDNAGFLDQKRCIIYRESRSSFQAMHCDTGSEMVLKVSK